MIGIYKKLTVLGSFLSRCDQCALYMNAGMIEFVTLEQILLVKLKNVLTHLAEIKQKKF